jgi:hypothetical protein
MSRTVHHTSYAHRVGNCANHDCARTSITIPKPWWAFGLGPSAACDFAGADHTVTDLRYSAAAMAAAALDGARPRPEPVSATLPRYRHPARSWQLGAMGASVRAKSRADRRLSVPTLRAVTADVNTFVRAHGTSRLRDWVEVDAVVVEPARHRRNVRADYGS